MKFFFLSTYFFLSGGISNAQIDSNENSVRDYILIYQKYLSGLRGNDCPMYPSCSHYGLDVFEQYNAFTAFPIMSDRLLRCGHDIKYYDFTFQTNGFKAIDLSSNDPISLSYLREGNYNKYIYASYKNLKEPGLILIRELMNSGLYEAALVEIKRTLLSGNSAITLDLLVNELICFKALGEYEEAIYTYEQFIPRTYHLEPEIVFQVSHNYYLLGNYNLTSSSLNSIKDRQDKSLQFKVSSLQGLSFVQQDNLAAAKSVFIDLAAADIKPEYSQQCISLIDDALQFKKKSGLISGLLGIVPGGGYAYARHYQTAVSSLLVNSLLGYATYSNIIKENYGMAALTGLFSLSFYIGNIQGGIKSASRYNEQNKSTLIESLENIIIL